MQPSSEIATPIPIFPEFFSTPLPINTFPQKILSWETMRNFGNYQVLEWLDEGWEKSDTEIDEVICRRDEIVLYFCEGDEQFLKIKIPMSPSNLDILKDQLSISDVGMVKETDERGRFNLGIEHSDQEKEVIVLDA